MTDGREFPGGTANPPLELLAGEGFFGRQSHEFDGSYLYWGHPEYTPFSEAAADYWNRLTRMYPDTVNARYSLSEYNAKTDKLYPYMDGTLVPLDMEKAAERLVHHLQISRFGHLRHTGPSTAFKYFYQAGYTWAGIESMYGPLELITAFLRGAASAYHHEVIGSHLAVQWSTTPHDQAERYRRFRAYLYSSYIQGIHDINTEEGFWHLEEYYNYFNRESEACRSHKAQQQDFYRFVSTHTRNGKFYTPMAFIHGRYDGFRSFVNDRLFGAENMDTDYPELSWELLSEFYTLEKANGGFYLHPCPTDHEPGMLTGTPRGNVDVVPIETDIDHLSRYRCIGFLGYNKALPEDMDKLYSYVCNGGTLLIAWPHLSVITNRQDILDKKAEIIEHPLTEMLSHNISAFSSDRYNGKVVSVNTHLRLENAEIIEKTEKGTPILVRYCIGSGKLLLINALEYPASPVIEDLYRRTIRSLSDEVNAMEDSIINCGDDVQFTMFDCPGRREIYLMAMDWYNEPDFLRHAELRVGKDIYSIFLPFGVLYKIVIMDDIAAFADTENAEVLSVSGHEVVLQGYGKVSLYIAHSGILEKHQLNFEKQAVLKVAY